LTYWRPHSSDLPVALGAKGEGEEPVVTVFECPNHVNEVGSVDSWSRDGQVQNPSGALRVFLEGLGPGRDLCLRIGSRFYSVKGVRFKGASARIIYVGADSFDDCENHDCCEIDPTSAKFDRKP
jgi:hypothetical protein